MKKQLGVLVAVSILGCGSTDDDSMSTSATQGDSTLTTSGGGGSGTVSSTPATASTTGATTTTASGTTASTSTTGQPITLDCTSGALGEPTVLFEGTVEAIPQSFTLTPDELQLYYVNDAQGLRTIERRVRSSKAGVFGAAEPVPEFAEVCAPLGSDLQVGTLDLSPDGLSVFISCEMDVTLPTTLIMATRARLSDPFAVDVTPRGTVGASFASADGLEGFSNVPDALDQVQHFRRASGAESFVEVDTLPFGLRSPDPSNDGLYLIGSVLVEGVTDYRLAMAARASLDDPFSEPSSAGFLVPPEGQSDASVAVSADCRTVYWLRYSSTGDTFSVMSSTRL